MKKLLALILFSGFLHYADAQHFKTGLIGGAVVSDIPGNDTIDNDLDFNKAGFVTGAFLNLPVTETADVQVEFTYIQKGYSMPPDTVNVYWYKLSLDYIEIPIMLKKRFKITIKQKTINNFEIEGGLAFGRLIRAYERDYITSNYNSTDFIKNNYSFLAGFSYHFSQHVAFNYRFQNSFNPVRTRNPLPAKRPSYWYLLDRGTNTVMSFSLRYTF